MPTAEARPYRAGWVITEGPDGRTATRGGRTLRQGAMSYHAFIVALDRIAGLRPWEDIMPRLRAGMGVEAAWEAAQITEEEAWAIAEAQAEGRTVLRHDAQEPTSPPPPQPPPPRAGGEQPSLFDLEEA